MCIIGVYISIKSTQCCLERILDQNHVLKNISCGAIHDNGSTNWLLGGAGRPFRGVIFFVKVKIGSSFWI